MTEKLSKTDILCYNGKKQRAGRKGGCSGCGGQDMNSRRDRKKRSREILKKHYWRCVAVSFIIAFLAGNYNGTFTAVFSYDSSKESVNVIQDNTIFDVNDIRGKSLREALREALIPNLEKKVREQEEYIKKSPYKKGIFALLFNYSMATGSVFSGIIAIVLKPIVKGRWYALFSSAAGAAFLFFWWLFVRNMIQIGGCRFYLEADTYRDTKGSRIFFLYKIRRVWKTAKVVLRRFLYQWLWSLTIVGGWIKGYSYMLVPYLAAENPDIGSREALSISRKMMDGHKWEAFLLDCSFLGWSLLSLCTLGLLNMLYTNPYKAGARAAFYLDLRKQALAEEAEYAYIFTDRYLAAPPAEEELRAGLCRAAAMEDRADWRELLAEAEIKPLDPEEEYSGALFTVAGNERKFRLGIDYHCHYGFTDIILLFFIFSCIGWMWEVSLHLAQSGDFVNRGVFHGPWLPIYGFGGVTVLVLLKKLRDHPVATFFASMAVCGLIEYATSWGLEQIHGGVRWWDYSGYFLNLNGRICAEGLVVFGLGACAFIYILAPLIKRGVLERIPVRVRVLLCVLLIGAFAGDFFYTRLHPNVGKGISKEIKTMLWKGDGYAFKRCQNL